MDDDQAVKVEADAMFLPIRLRTKLIAQVATLIGIYPASCKYVNYGFFGNFEIISHKAIWIYIDITDDGGAPLNHVCGDI